MAFAAAMCILYYAYVYECDHDVQSVHMHVVGDVHVHEELVSFETRFSIFYG